MARRPLPCAVSSVLLLVVGLAAACDPPAGSVMRDPSSRQVLSFREDGYSILRYAADGKAIFLQKQVPPAEGSQKSDPVLHDIYRVGISSGEREQVATAVLNFYEDGSVSDPPAFVAVSQPRGGKSGYAATVTFPDGSAPVSVDYLASPSCCDWLSSPWAVRRYDSSLSKAQLWVGSFRALMPLDAKWQVTSWRHSATAPVFLAIATTDTPSAVMRPTYGIWALGDDGAAPQLLIPPTLGPFSAVDPTEDTSKIASSSLVETAVDLQECFSPGDWTTGFDWGIAGTRCYSVYQRSLNTGMDQTRLFLHLDGEPEELLLPGTSPSSVNVSGWNGRWLTWWGRTGADAHYALFAYDLQTKAVQQCQTSSPGAVLWQSNAPGLIIVSGGNQANQIQTWDLASPTCPVVATANQPSFVASPDGKRWAWLETNAMSGSKITLADRDLSNQRVIAVGTYFQQIGFLDNRRMLIWRTGLDGFGYSWIDTSLDQPVEHALAEQVFFISSRLDAQRILIGHRFSDQDQTGDLSLINMDTGEEQLISHGVSEATLRFEDSQDGGKTRLLDVAFIVRGRYASATHDGLWQAKIPFDIPPQ